MKSNCEYTLIEGPLIARARQGNSDAFSELARMHSQHIYSISLRMLKNHADAEDNLQDVLCKVYANIRRFQGRSRFSTWIVRITINEALMKIRKEKSGRAAGQTDLPWNERNERTILEIEDGRPNPERQYIANDLAKKAFRGLHPSLRRTFILHKGEGWTHCELAGSMGVAVATVKSRIFRARAKMQEHLHALC